MKLVQLRRALAPAIALALFAQTLAAERPKAKRTAVEQPKLVLFIFVDQFRADYLMRFNHLFGSKGFKRLIANGAYFTNANYPYANTITAVGHASVMTGSISSIHGIIGNEFYDREMGRDVKVSEDDRVKGLGSVGGFSPWRLKSSTIGDQLRLSNNFKSRAFAVSIKDRSAVMMGGRRPNAAYWYDGDNGKMVSSTYYMDSLPAWVENFNKERNTDRYFQQKWEKSLPEDAYKISDRDDAPYESTWRGNTKTFPHIIDGGGSKIGPDFYTQFKGTPFANELLTKFTIGLIENERLGNQESADFLGLSYSATDYCGHIFGPYSQEVQDMIVRLDGQLARLFDEIDKRIGLDKTIVVLTADHGVPPIPGYSLERGFNALLIGKEDLQEQLEKILKARYGEGNYLLWYGNEQIYLNEEELKKKGFDLAEAEEFIGREASKLPGIATYFTRTKLLKNEAPNTVIGRRIMAGFHPKLSGNVWLLVEPFVVIEWKHDIYVTTHKTPYHYDTHVPIVMSGPGIKAGVYNGERSPTDIAPTISTILKIEAPSGSIGKVMTEAIK